MLDFILWIVVLGLSLFFLVKSSDFFIEYAEKIGMFLGFPSFVIGIIILAVGTSLPELVSSVVAVIKGSSEIVMGNVLGSNIANILLVLGVISVMKKGFSLGSRCMKFDFALLFAVTVILLIASYNRSISFYEGSVLLFLVVVYIFHTNISEKPIIEEVETGVKDKNILKNTAILFASCYLIYISSDWTIKSVITLSELLLIPKEFIAITVVAFGTSLPELIVSFSAVKKGSSDMAIGNILGSCVFNTLAVVGVSALFGKLLVTDNLLNLAFPVLFLSVILLTINGLSGRISRLSGGIYIVIYFLFIIGLNFTR